MNENSMKISLKIYIISSLKNIIRQPYLEASVE